MRRLLSIALTIAFIITLNIGCEKKQGEIKIGAILPLTGDAAKYGEAAKRGIELAIKEINAIGGISGKKIRIMYEDDQANPNLGVSAFYNLITRERVSVILGPLPSSVTLAVAPIAEKNRIVLLSPASSTPAITEAGDYIFRNVASDQFEGAAMAEFVYNELFFKKIAIIYINNDFGVGLKDSFKKKFEELGGEIIATEAFEQGATDFRTQLLKVKSVNPEGIYLVGYKEMGRVLKQAGELGIKSQFLSFAMFEDPEILKIAGNTAEGVYYSFRSYDPRGEEEHVTKFVKNFRNQYDMEPDIFAALSYDATRIIALAMKKGGFTSERIKEALYTISDFPGVTGKLSFDENGDVIGTNSIKMVRDGEFVWYKKSFSF